MYRPVAKVTIVKDSVNSEASTSLVVVSSVMEPLDVLSDFNESQKSTLSCAVSNPCVANDCLWLEPKPTVTPSTACSGWTPHKGEWKNKGGHCATFGWGSPWCYTPNRTNYHGIGREFIQHSEYYPGKFYAPCKVFSISDIERVCSNLTVSRALSWHQAKLGSCARIFALHAWLHMCKIFITRSPQHGIAYGMAYVTAYGTAHRVQHNLDMHGNIRSVQHDTEAQYNESCGRQVSSYVAHSTETSGEGNGTKAISHVH